MVSMAPRNEGSPAGAFDWQTDGAKLLKGLGVALAGAALTYLEETIPGVDFGSYTALVVGVNSVLVNFARKWLTNTSKNVRELRKF